MKTVENIAKEAIKAQLQLSDFKTFKSDTHVIARRLRDKLPRGEPITIENFVIDTIKSVIILVINKSDSRFAVVRFTDSYDYKPN